MRIRAIVTAAVLTGLSVGTAQAQTTDSTSTLPSRTTTPGLVVVAPGATAAQIGALTAAQTATAPAANPSSTANTPAARAAANNAKMQAASTPSTTPGTAFDQGFTDPNAAAQAAAALADYQEFSSARQKGVQVPAPLPTNTVASHPELRGWLANWKDLLAAVGVDDRRVNFEAARLNQDEFARWGSRLVRANDPSLNEVTAQPAAQAVPVVDADPSAD